MKNLLFVLFACALCFTPLQIEAWGDKGHALVAEVAFKQLDKKTRKLVLSYLDGMSIEEAANWMDVIKKDPAFDALKPLHYANFEKGTIVKDSCCDNIIYTLTTTLSKLKNYHSLTKAELKTQLCYLFHLMGDVHQPLHLGYASDKGGNSYKVQFNGKGTNLHGLFDYGIIESEGITLKQCLKATKYSDQEKNELSKGGVVQWATESRNYLGLLYATNGTEISENYTQTNATLIKNQIQKAGIRLAALLKSIFQEV